MAERSLSLAKIRAYDDIKRMIKFLQEEQESIDGAGKKRQFFRKNIETIFENNFKGKLPIEEYESIIFDICIAKTLILGDTHEGKIAKKIEDSILQCNIRNKDLISEKISMASKPISLVLRMPSAVPTGDSSQAELMSPSFMMISPP